MICALKRIEIQSWNVCVYFHFVWLQLVCELYSLHYEYTIYAATFVKVHTGIFTFIKFIFEATIITILYFMSINNYSYIKLINFENFYYYVITYTRTYYRFFNINNKIKAVDIKSAFIAFSIFSVFCNILFNNLYRN